MSLHQGQHQIKLHQMDLRRQLRQPTGMEMGWFGAGYPKKPQLKIFSHSVNNLNQVELYTSSYRNAKSLGVQVTDSTIKFLRDGFVVYTSATAPTFPLVVSTSFNGITSSSGPAYEKSNMISEVAIHSASIRLACTACPSGKYVGSSSPVTWTSVVGLAASAGALQKTAGTGAWDAGAVSTQEIVSNAEHLEPQGLTFRCSANSAIFVGLGKSVTNVGANSAEFAIKCDTNSMAVWESGSVIASFPSIATDGTDLFEVRITARGNSVQYLQNDAAKSWPTPQDKCQHSRCMSTRQYTRWAVG
jgi:hypothetical protein